MCGPQVDSGVSCGFCMKTGMMDTDQMNCLKHYYSTITESTSNSKVRSNHFLILFCW
jgi:hypothetical protein